METLFSINTRLKDAENVVIFGAGFYGQEMLQYLTKIGVKVHYWCDSNKIIGQKINGIEVIAPKMLTSMKNLCVVIASTKAWQAIYKKLIDLGIDQEDIVSHVGLGNLCVLREELLRDKKIFIAGVGVQGTLTFLQLLRRGVYVQGFLDNDENVKGGKLLHKKIYSEDEIEDWERAALICTEDNIMFSQCNCKYVDNSYHGFLGEKLGVAGGEIYIWQLHDLERLSGDRKIIIYGTGIYAQSCYNTRFIRV